MSARPSLFAAHLREYAADLQRRLDDGQDLTDDDRELLRELNRRCQEVGIRPSLQVVRPRDRLEELISDANARHYAGTETDADVAFAVELHYRLCWIDFAATHPMEI